MNPFYVCCPTLQKFVDVLFESNSTKCGTFARSQSQQTAIYQAHIALDSCAYVAGVLSELKKKKTQVFIINTESLETDFYRIARTLGWSLRNHSSSNYIGHSFKLKPHEEVTSEDTRQKLKKYLELTGELNMYNTLQAEFKK